MTFQAFILFASDTDWQVCAVTEEKASFADCPTPPDATAPQRAQALAAALRAAGHGGQPVILAIPSDWCYSASIPVDDLPRGDRKAMVYRLEEKLPLPAESLIADFIVTTEPAVTALGVCVAVDLLKEIVDALETAGVAVQSIAPAVLLATQGLSAELSPGATVLLCGEGSPEAAHISIIALQGGRPASWSLVQANIADVKLQIELVALEGDGSPRVQACGVDDELIEQLTEATGLIILPREGHISEMAARFAQKMLSGRQRPWVEFRRGSLAIQDPLRQFRKPLNALIASAAVLLLAFSAVMLYRGARHQHAARAADAQLVEAFGAQFPGWPLPANVRAVIESEHRKAAARSGESLPPQASRSALQTMREVLEQLPGEGRFTIDRVTFEDQAFEMEGRLRSYEDVDAVAAAGRRAGLSVDPPQAHKDSAGLWSFTLHGVRPSSAG